MKATLTIEWFDPQGELKEGETIETTLRLDPTSALLTVESYGMALDVTGGFWWKRTEYEDGEVRYVELKMCDELHRQVLEQVG